MTDFTPGPWRLNGSQAKAQVSCGEQGRGYVVAQAMGYTHSSHHEAEANARLIAAAPELYAALEGLLSTHKQGKGECCAEADAAIAALAKARGPDA